MIAQYTVVFGINSTCNVQNTIWLRLMLFWTLLMLLIPNTTVNCAITYTNSYPCLNYLISFSSIVHWTWMCREGHGAQGRERLMAVTKGRQMDCFVQNLYMVCWTLTALVEPIYTFAGCKLHLPNLYTFSRYVCEANYNRWSYTFVKENSACWIRVFLSTKVFSARYL